jgi:hypothetical protein
MAAAVIKPTAQSPKLECLFTTSIDQYGDSYRIEIPRSELEQGTITSGETYRVALVSSTPARMMFRRQIRIRTVPPSSHYRSSRETYAR